MNKKTPISTIVVNSNGLLENSDTHHMVDDDVQIVSANVMPVLLMQQMIVMETNSKLLISQS